MMANRNEGAWVIDRIVLVVRTLIERIFPRGALVLSVLSLAYFAMGIVRNRIFANTYGAGSELDAYNAAFRIPEIIFDVVVASGLTAPFVPLFLGLREGTSDDEPANDFGRTVLTAVVLAMAVASAAIFVGAPWIATVAVGDFDQPTRDLYIQLLRINTLAQILFAASLGLGEILIAHRRFAFYAFAPILYTTGIILGTVLFSERFGIAATAWGAVAGAGAHLVLRAIGTTRTSFRIRPGFHVRTPTFRAFLRLMVPRMASVGIEPLTFAYFTAVAAGLGAGSITALNFALDYQVLPVSLIGVSFSLAVFPVLAAAFSGGDRDGFRRVLLRNVAIIGLLTSAAAIALFVLSGILVEVLLGGGRFGPEAVALTASVVAVFAISIPFDALAYPLSRALYATHNTIYQVISSFAGLGAVVLASQAMLGPLGILAIPLGYAAGVATKDVLLAMFLARRVGRIGVSRPG